LSLTHAETRVFSASPSQLPLSDGGGVRLFLARGSLMDEKDWQDMLQGDDGAARMQQMAQKGSAKAMCAWGKMLLGGHGVAQDEAQAVDWFKQAAARDDAPAINLLGRCYEHGWGVEPDMVAAFSFYERAAALGEAWGLFNLADCYRNGRAIARNLPRAFALYERAVRAGHVKSLNMLGLMHEEGEGVARDEEKAAYYFAQGAERGDCWACFNHARLLAARGAWAQALHWLEQSLHHQVGDYCQSVATLFAEAKNEDLRQFAKRARTMAEKNSRAEKNLRLKA